MQKIRKILRAVSEKTALPTNQATNYYQQHRSYRTSLTPVQKIYENIQVTSEVKHIGELSFFHVLLMRVDRKSETTVFCKETV